MEARNGFAVIAFLAAALASCGGSGAGGGGAAGTLPTTTPTPGSTVPTPTINVDIGSTVNVNLGPTQTTVSLPVAPGASYSGTMTFGAGSGRGELAASTAVPSGTTPLVFRRMVRSRSESSYTVVSYIALTAVSAIAIDSSNVTISAGVSSGYHVAFYQQGFWVTLPQGGPFSLPAKGNAYFAVYAGGTLPSPNPDGCVGVQPDQVNREKGNVVGVQPLTPGTSFAYTGTLEETFVRATPCAVPNATFAAAVAVLVTLSPGPGSQVNEDSSESDAYNNETITTNTDAVVQVTSSPIADALVELDETTTDEVGDSTTTTYDIAPLVYAVGSPLPFSGAISNDPPSNVDTTLADGTTMNRTYAPNGTYNELDTLAGSDQSTITVDADGSGTYNIDYQGQNNAGGTSAYVLSFSAPADGTILLTINSSADPSPQTLSIPAWFASGANFHTDTVTDNTVTSLPQQCDPQPAVVPTDDVHRVISTLDPVLGYTENEVIDAYVVRGTPTVGPACVTISDVEADYYDYNLDTPFIVYASLQIPAAPMQTRSIEEAYWYDASPVSPAAGTRAAIESFGGAPGLAASIAAHMMGVAFHREVERAREMASFALRASNLRRRIDPSSCEVHPCARWSRNNPENREAL